MTGIEWTDQTWNPATGCSKVSSGCRNCYAEVIAKRQQALKPAGRYRNGFAYTEHEDKVEDPLHWKKPRRVFVNSMSDFFHEDATWPFLRRCLDTMRRCPQHTFQILTKRPAAAVRFIGDQKVRDPAGPWPENAWLGVSCEDERQVGRIRELVTLGEAVPVKFVSFEPLIGPIPWDALGEVGEDIQWAIVGGESGPGHRPMKGDWARDLLAYCQAYGVKFFFKQWGGITPKAGGRELDGKVYDEWPESPRPATLCEVLK